MTPWLGGDQQDAILWSSASPCTGAATTRGTSQPSSKYARPVSASLLLNHKLHEAGEHQEPCSTKLSVN